jgi:hypothetical protein
MNKDKIQNLKTSRPCNSVKQIHKGNSKYMTKPNQTDRRNYKNRPRDYIQRNRKDPYRSRNPADEQMIKSYIDNANARKFKEHKSNQKMGLTQQAISKHALEPHSHYKSTANINPRDLHGGYMSNKDHIVPNPSQSRLSQKLKRMSVEHNNFK